MRQKEKKPLKLSQVLLALAIVLTPILLFVFSGDNTPLQTNSNNSAIQETTGTYADHDGKQYQYVIGQKDGNQTATFQPALPRDDNVVTGAILNFINAVYGKNTLASLQPQLVERDGNNLIMFQGVQGDYFALLIKNDLGEVHSIALWRE